MLGNTKESWKGKANILLTKYGIFYEKVPELLKKDQLFDNFWTAERLENDKSFDTNFLFKLYSFDFPHL